MQCEKTTTMDNNLLSLDNLDSADPSDLLRQRNRVQAMRRQSVMRSRRESGTGDNLHHHQQQQQQHPHRPDSAATQHSQHTDDDNDDDDEEDLDDEVNGLDEHTS